MRPLNPEFYESKTELVKTVPVQITLEEGASLPEYKSAEAAGMDLKALEDMVLHPHIPTLVKTGVKIAIPKGYEGQVRPRSGLALKGVTVYNSPGTIDSDYRGDVGVILLYLPQKGNPKMSLPPDIFEIKKGDRIAQLVIAECAKAALDPVLVLSETVRGEGGFGHTGV